MSCLVLKDLKLSRCPQLGGSNGHSIPEKMAELFNTGNREKSAVARKM